MLETLLTVNGLTVDLAEQQLRRTLSHYVASQQSSRGRGGGGGGGDAALLKLTSGLSDVAAKYATVRTRGGECV